MFGLGSPELMVILVIAFLVFGGRKLPELGAGLGKGITAFKKGLGDRKNDTIRLKEESSQLDHNHHQKRS